MNKEKKKVVGGARMSEVKQLYLILTACKFFACQGVLFSVEFE